MRAAKPCFPRHPKVRWACSCRQTEKHTMTEGSTNASQPHMESMLTEAECYCAKLSMAIFLAKCCDNLSEQPRRLRQNKQATIFQHCRHAAIDQRAIMYSTASKSFHGDSVACASNNTHRRPSTTNDREWLVGGWSGTEQKLLKKILHVYVFSRKKRLIPLDRGLIALDTLYDLKNSMLSM